MVCRVEMPANEQIFGRFYRWRMLHSQNGGGRGTIITLMVVLVALAALTLGLGVSPIAIAVVAALLVVWLVYMFWLKPNQLFRKKEAAALHTEVTIFTKTSFTRTVKSEEGGPPETTSVNFSTLVKAVETSRDFYLFTSPAQAYMVDKEYFTNGTPEELRAVLAEQLGKKFKGKK